MQHDGHIRIPLCLILFSPMLLCCRWVVRVPVCAIQISLAGLFWCVDVPVPRSSFPLLFCLCLLTLQCIHTHTPLSALQPVLPFISFFPTGLPFPLLFFFHDEYPGNHQPHVWQKYTERTGAKDKRMRADGVGGMFLF